MFCYILVFVLLIIIAILLFNKNGGIMSFLGRGTGNLIYSNLTGQKRQDKREEIRTVRRSNNPPDWPARKDNTAERLLSSTWVVETDGNEKIIKVSGEASGKIKLLDWPNTDSWIFESDKYDSAYCLDMTKEYDDKIIARLNTYLIAERSQ